jgi:hypothetical protein
MGVKSEEDAPQPRARHKRVWASVERSPAQVTEEVFQEALRGDRNRARAADVGRWAGRTAKRAAPNLETSIGLPLTELHTPY